MLARTPVLKEPAWVMDVHKKIRKIEKVISIDCT